jgi:hypothetical protein
MNKPRIDPKKPATQLTFSLAAADRKALERLAREADLSVSQLVRRGVKRMLTEDGVAA